MPDFTLYYWPIPFRGQFVRAVLAQAQATWREVGLEDTARLRLEDPADQVVPHMGPPVLTDHATGFSVSQMPAILGYLGQKFRLVPDDAERTAMTDKLPGLRPILDQSAPAVVGLTDRIFALPEQADLQARSDAEYGEAWCSGQIEASLRAVI